MGHMIMQVGLWVAAGATLLLYFKRRRTRKSLQ